MWGPLTSLGQDGLRVHINPIWPSNSGKWTEGSARSSQAHIVGEMQNRDFESKIQQPHSVFLSRDLLLQLGAGGAVVVAVAISANMTRVAKFIQ